MKDARALFIAQRPFACIEKFALAILPLRKPWFKPPFAYL